MPSAERGIGARGGASGTHSGGTSVVEEGGGMGVWVAAVGGLAVAGGVALFLLRGEGESSSRPEAAEPAAMTDAEPATDQPRLTEPGQAPGDLDDNEAPFADVELQNKRIAVADQISRDLDSIRLWSSVDVDGATLDIGSAYCGEEGMRTALAVRQQDLEATGFELVRCRERHGPLVFESSLAELSGGEGATAEIDAGAGE